MIWVSDGQKLYSRYLQKDPANQLRFVQRLSIPQRARLADKLNDSQRQQLLATQTPAQNLRFLKACGICTVPRETVLSDLGAEGRLSVYRSASNPMDRIHILEYTFQNDAQFEQLVRDLTSSELITLLINCVEEGWVELQGFIIRLLTPDDRLRLFRTTTRPLQRVLILVDWQETKLGELLSSLSNQEILSLLDAFRDLEHYLPTCKTTVRPFLYRSTSCLQILKILDLDRRLSIYREMSAPSSRVRFIEDLSQEYYALEKGMTSLLESFVNTLSNAELTSLLSDCLAFDNVKLRLTITDRIESKRILALFNELTEADSKREFARYLRPHQIDELREILIPSEQRLLPVFCSCSC